MFISNTKKEKDLAKTHLTMNQQDTLAL